MIFIINGYPGSGKDTFVDFVKSSWNDFRLKRPEFKSIEIKNISTIDYLKDVFRREFYWDGLKTPEARNALANIHKELTIWNNLPFIKTSGLIQSELDKGNIVFLHCREPENIKLYKKEFNSITIFVNNSRAKEETLKKNNTSLADIEVENYKYDIIIDNNASLIELQDKAKSFIYDAILND